MEIVDSYLSCQYVFGESIWVLVFGLESLMRKIVVVAVDRV